MKDKHVFTGVTILSVVVVALVLALNERVLGPPTEFPDFLYHLPKLHAIINGTVAILLILSLRAIKKKNIALHKKLNVTAFILSALFLVSYVTYHYFVKHTVHPGEGAVLFIYKAVLLSHILLSTIVLPLVLISFWYGLKNKVAQHRRITRFSYPIWLYVAISGVVVYLMISPYYVFPN